MDPYTGCNFDRATAPTRRSAALLRPPGRLPGSSILFRGRLRPPGPPRVLPMCPGRIVTHVPGCTPKGGGEGGDKPLKDGDPPPK